MGRKSKKKQQQKRTAPAAGAAKPAAAQPKQAKAAAKAPPSQALQNVGRVSALVLGSLFLLAGTFKVGDPWSFVASLPAYGIPEAVQVPIALLMPTIEILLGIMLVAGWRVREASLATALFLIAFGAAIAYGWNAGTLEDCGCFGPFLKSSPPVALARDGGMMVLAILGMLWAPVDTRGFAESFSRARIGTLATVTVVSLAMISSVLFRDEGTLAERLAAAEALGADSATSLASLNLAEREDVFLYLFHPDCPHCVSFGPMLARIADDPDLPEVIGITTNVASGQVRYYKQNSGARFQAYEMPSSSFFRITGDANVPQLVHMKRGEIERVWGGQRSQVAPVPNLQQLREYMSTQ